jgi:hypothetical protein
MSLLSRPCCTTRERWFFYIFYVWLVRTRLIFVFLSIVGNVDHALLQFMKTWFPREAKIKQKANEEESLQETIEEFGTDLRCFIM